MHYDSGAPPSYIICNVAYETDLIICLLGNETLVLLNLLSDGCELVSQHASRVSSDDKAECSWWPSDLGESLLDGLTFFFDFFLFSLLSGT